VGAARRADGIIVAKPTRCGTPIMDHATRERPLARLLASVSAPLLTCLHAERPSNNVGLGAKLTIARSPSYSYRSLCLIKSSAKMGTSTMMMPSHRRLFSRMNSALRAATNASTSRTTAAAAAAAAAENADDAAADEDQSVRSKDLIASVLCCRGNTTD
jgi:hypothetical protein